jgi:hypothetical protein
VAVRSVLGFALMSVKEGGSHCGAVRFQYSTFLSVPAEWFSLTEDEGALSRYRATEHNT